jgi:hypothetical protein
MTGQNSYFPSFVLAAMVCVSVPQRIVKGLALIPVIIYGRIFKSWGLLGCRISLGFVLNRWLHNDRFFPLPFSFFPGHAVNWFLLLHASANLYCLTTGPKATGPMDHEIKPSKLEAKISLSSFKLIISDILLQYQEAD